MRQCCSHEGKQRAIHVLRRQMVLTRFETRRPGSLKQIRLCVSLINALTHINKCKILRVSSISRALHCTPIVILQQPPHFCKISLKLSLSISVVHYLFNHTRYLYTSMSYWCGVGTIKVLNAYTFRILSNHTISVNTRDHLASINDFSMNIRERRAAITFPLDFLTLALFVFLLLPFYVPILHNYFPRCIHLVSCCSTKAAFLKNDLLLKFSSI